MDNKNRFSSSYGTCRVTTLTIGGKMQEETVQICISQEQSDQRSALFAIP